MTIASNTVGTKTLSLWFGHNATLYRVWPWINNPGTGFIEAIQDTPIMQSYDQFINTL